MPSLANKTNTPYYNPLLSQQGWIVLPTIIITARMRSAIHTSTTKSPRPPHPHQQSLQINGNIFTSHHKISNMYHFK